MTEWKNRITGYEVVNPNDITPNPRNWRRHPDEQKAAMASVLGALGWVGPLIVNTTTGHIVDGHDRQEQAIANGEPGVPVLWVELTQEEEDLALATFDPLSAMAHRDAQLYEDLLSDLDARTPELTSLLETTLADIKTEQGKAKDGGEAYTRRVRSPIYEPTGTKPAPQDLYDKSRTGQLLEDIEIAGIDDNEVLAFLRAAAMRHTEFRFGRIAEFYAQSPPEIQRLMEDSALVIIDFEKAIENGYVALIDEALEQYRTDKDDA